MAFRFIYYLLLSMDILWLRIWLFYSSSVISSIIFYFYISCIYYFCLIVLNCCRCRTSLSFVIVEISWVNFYSLISAAYYSYTFFVLNLSSYAYSYFIFALYPFTLFATASSTSFSLSLRFSTFFRYSTILIDISSIYCCKSRTPLLYFSFSSS